MNKKSLSNSKMGQLVARLLGKPQLDVKDGKVSLSEEEKKTIRDNYGEPFLAKLESVDIEDDSESALDLFNAAVAAKTAEATAALTSQIKSLQASVLELTNEPEPKPAAKAAAPAGAQAFAVNMNASHNKIVANALNSTNPLAFGAIEDASIDIKDLNAEFSSVMPPKAKLELLTKRIYNGFPDARYMTRIQANSDYIASAAMMSEVSQQFTPKWTPKGTVKFTPIRIPYRRHKINVLIQPAEILKSWLLFLYEQGKTMAEMPISKYIIENHILPKVLDDITLSMIAKGKFVDAGTVSDGDKGKAAKDSMDGFETILVEGKKDAKCKINFYKNAKDPMTLGNQEVLDYINGFVDAISGMFANVVTVYCSEQLLTKYKRADFAINGKYTGVETDGAIRFTNFHLVPLRSMYNSPIIFATPQENFVELVDYSKAESCINKIEESNYDVKVFGEYSLSTGFKIAEAVFASVPDGYDPSTTIASGEVDLGDKWENGATSRLAKDAEGEETV
ncbi:MAG: hypothetical protein PUB47_01625 [Bacteroides sp.]|nr:hypothetical protein [Bacteroides sp.]